MFETGDLVKWKIKDIVCRGIFRKELENEYEVICYEINNVSTKKKLNVVKELVEKDEI